MCGWGVPHHKHQAAIAWPHTVAHEPTYDVHAEALPAIANALRWGPSFRRCTNGRNGLVRPWLGSVCHSIQLASITTNERTRRNLITGLVAWGRLRYTS